MEREKAKSLFDDVDDAQAIGGEHAQNTRFEARPYKGVAEYDVLERRTEPTLIYKELCAHQIEREQPTLRSKGRPSIQS